MDGWTDGWMDLWMDIRIYYESMTIYIIYYIYSFISSMRSGY